MDTHTHGIIWHLMMINSSFFSSILEFWIWDQKKPLLYKYNICRHTLHTIIEWSLDDDDDGHFSLKSYVGDIVSSSLSSSFYLLLIFTIFLTRNDDDDGNDIHISVFQIDKHKYTHRIFPYVCIISFFSISSIQQTV